MKILIFYSSTGAGHLKTAEALAEQLIKTKRTDVAVIDGLIETGFGSQISPSSIFLFISTYTIYLFNFIFTSTNNTLGVKTLRVLTKLVWGKNFRRIIDREKPDLIISTHFFMTSQTTSAFEKKIPFVFVVTDLGFPHKSLHDQNADALITPTKEIAEYVNKVTNIPKNKIFPLGYPLRKGYSINKSTGELQNILLCLGGGLGSGGMDEIALTLSRNFPDKKIIVICGYNKKLQKKLISSNIPNLEVFGFVDNLDYFMKQSDIIITKAGPSTIMEAASLGKPIIITSWVGLQEKDNVKFIIENNLGVYSPNLTNLKDCVDNIYRNYSKYSKGYKKFKSGTKKIVKFLARFGQQSWHKFPF